MADALIERGLRELLKERIRRAWRRLLILLVIRRITPRDGERPDERHIRMIPPLDTGGAYRPSHRPQDPSSDPHEPYGSESSGTGSDHAWSGCTMSSGADAIAYATGGELTPWGGDMRHRQGDLSGGTDLVDLSQAFAAYGESLTIKSGAGWSAVVDAHDEGRAIVIQGTGEVPGAGSFDGGHACCIGTETHSDGRWLWGDPLVSGWQWISPGEIRKWAERWQASIAFGVTVLPPAEDGPMDIAVLDPNEKLVDLSSGILILNLDGSKRLELDGSRTGVLSPFATKSGGGTALRAIVYTRADPSPDLLLAAYTSDCRNIRPTVPPAPPPDIDEDTIRAERDAEWIAHLTP
jgi:hypothetical protein